MDTKPCSKCDEVKSLNEYYKDKQKKDGHRPNCKACHNKVTMAYQKTDKGKEYRKAYEQTDEYKERMKAYRQTDEYKERIKAYTQTDEYKEARRAYSKTDKCKEYRRAYTKTDDRRKYNRRYVRNKRANNPSFYMADRLRNRLNKALNGNSKSASTEKLLGCTFEEARAHIEAQFTKGMSWDKMGKDGIHIDHIRPCASFDLTDPEQQRACFHYTNLQPLWAKDNMAKGDKWDGEK